MRIPTAILTVISTLLLVASAAHANLLLNGSFETNSASGSMFNMSNATFNATVANATAFGSAQEIDLVTGTDFGIAPQHGNWKLGIHTQTNGNFDAFSLDTSSPVVAGQTYVLQFYAAQLAGSTAGTIEIGLSTSASSFGAAIFTGTPGSASAWSLMSQTFAAPNAGGFLTVHNVNTSGYSFIDNFSLTAAAAVPEPSALALVGLGVLAAAFRRRRHGGR